MVDYQLLAAVAGILGAVTGLGSLLYTLLKFRSEDRVGKNFENMVNSHDQLVRTLKEDTEQLIKTHGDLVEAQKHDIESLVESNREHIEVRKNEIESMIKSNEVLVETLKRDTGLILASHGELVQAFQLDVDSLRREVSILRSEVEKRGRIDALEIEHKKQELAQRNVEQKWGIVSDIARGAGWLLNKKDKLKRKK